MKILGIDPGTRCGWGLLNNGERIGSGVWDLLKGPAGRFVNLRTALEETLALTRPDLVAYEDVKGHVNAGVLAGHIYGGIVAVVLVACHDFEVRALPVHTGTVKRKATGKGNAKKEAMVKAALGRWKFEFPPTADEADALWVAAAAEN